MTDVAFDYLGVRWATPQPIEKLMQNVPRHPGHKLPNGAIILAETVIRQVKFRRDSIVLAITNGHTPFTSWHRLVTSDSPMGAGGYGIVDTCMWGDYCLDLSVAIEKFEARVESKRISLMKEDMRNQGG